MSRFQEKLVLGNKITVETIPGRDDQIIGRLPDGRVILFDQKSPYFNSLTPGKSVECHIIYIQENYIIASPISEPEELETVHIPEVYVDDIIEDLEKLVEDVSGNAEVIPKALLKIIRLDQLIIRILTGED